jgi:hypothetical protein
MKKLIVVLTGGLGNQLFQIQFAQYMKEKTKCKIYFDISLGKPRKTNGVPDSLQHGSPEEIIRSRHSKLASKSIAYVMRSSYSPKKFEEFFLTNFITKCLASVILSIHFRSWLLIRAPKDLGYDPLFCPAGRNILTMGYFQTFKYQFNQTNANKVFTQIPKSKQIAHYKNLAEIEKPLVIHVRRGDYLFEDDFGILGADYYSRALHEISKVTDVGKIWLFSDAPKTAISLLPERFHDQVRVIEEIDQSPSNTLEVMRCGHSYIIANSTFSWWAAFSSYSHDTPVIAPSKWFKKMTSPNQIIPENWIRVDSGFV